MSGQYLRINNPSDDESEVFLAPSSSHELSRILTANESRRPLPASARRKKEKYCDVKTVAFFGVGIVTLLYCVAELGIGGWLNSLALLADGFHNLSDVVSLVIANWANQATKKPSTYDMSFGWARSEILGGLINAVFLLALCLYTSLEAIFEFIEPKPIDATWWYMGVAAAGVLVNTLGTLIFCATGNAHGHSHGGGGHGHSHGGHGHAHGDKKKKKKHGHGHGDKKEKHGHGHGHGDKKEKHGHGHGHGDKKHKKKHDHDHDHDHDHHDHDDHDHDHEGHGHNHGDKKHKKKKDKHGHGHGHGHGHDDHGHGHGEKKVRRDENVYAVFIHYLGDMVSSLMVLIGGIIIHFFGPEEIVCGVKCDYLDVGGHAWTNYIDPVVSLLIVALILYTSLPVVIRCVWILLQKAPDDMNVMDVREALVRIDGVASVHDLHIWQLVDGMVFCSAHIAVREGGSWPYVSTAIRRILHKHGVHSSSIQPEFLAHGAATGEFCEQNCIEDCAEDWCCKTPAESHRENSLAHIATEDPFSANRHSISVHSIADSDDDH